MNTDLWVDGRLASLQGVPGWNPDAAKALARLRERDRAYRSHKRRWAWVAAASIVSFSVLAMPGRCEMPGAHFCGQPLASRLMHQALATAVAVRQPPVLAPFKEVGSPAAPITLEIYTDYECPACASLYRDTMPRLMADYVATGKIKLIHRDFPLPQHAYARLAARYANAAGRLGQYELAVNRLFETQNQWSADGNVDRQLSQVLPPATMQQVRDLVEHDASLDDTIIGDMTMAAKDVVHQTPTTVVVYRGKRQAFAGVPDYRLLKQYLDNLLAR